MTLSLPARIVIAVFILTLYFGAGPAMRALRRRRYTRGRKLSAAPKRKQIDAGELAFGNIAVSRTDATRHFLVVGTTGSGKTLLQRLLMRRVLRGIEARNNRRALIFDAKNDVVPYLKQIGVTCPVFSLNPLESRTTFPEPVAWNIAADVTSPARAQNLVANLIPSEQGGSNQYFTDAARQVVTGVCSSFIRHSPGDWSFSDFVFSCLARERVQEVLIRDAEGREILDGFFGDDRTAYQVFTTVYSRMAYYRPVAAMWQRVEQSLSLREWLTSDSILLLGQNATVKTALDAINEIIVRVIVEEIDEQPNSTTRETWLWIDEARLAGPLLKSDILPYVAVKGRSKGARLVLGFQDIEGLREAAGPRIANEVVAQCSHKALLRMESEESAKWASQLLGQFETIEVFSSDSAELGRGSKTVSEQRVTKEAVLPSEFYSIPVTSREMGLTGYFVSTACGAVQDTVTGKELQAVVVPEHTERRWAFVPRPEEDQELRPWEPVKRQVLGLEIEAETKAKGKLRFKGRSNILSEPVTSSEVTVRRP